MDTCAFCEAKPIYRDGTSGARLCPVHAGLSVSGPREETPRPPLTFRPAMPADLPQITRLAAYCWNDVELERFAQRYRVDDLPAHVACDEDEVVGAASYARDEGTIRLVMLAVMPHWQGRGAAKALLDELIDEARAAGARRVVAATTNAGLPALQLYQRYGFAITGVLVGALVEPDGEATPGFGGIPVRDEIQLELRL